MFSAVPVDCHMRLTTVSLAMTSNTKSSARVAKKALCFPLGSAAYHVSYNELQAAAAYSLTEVPMSCLLFLALEERVWQHAATAMLSRTHADRQVSLDPQRNRCLATTRGLVQVRPPAFRYKTTSLGGSPANLAGLIQQYCLILSHKTRHAIGKIQDRH